MSWTLRIHMHTTYNSGVVREGDRYNNTIYVHKIFRCLEALRLGDVSNTLNCRTLFYHWMSSKVQDEYFLFCNRSSRQKIKGPGVYLVGWPIPFPHPSLRHLSITKSTARLRVRMNIDGRCYTSRLIASSVYVRMGSVRFPDTTFCPTISNLIINKYASNINNS